MTSGTRSYAVDVLALALILAALAVALTKTSGLAAPDDHWDHFRDSSQAQTVRDGAPLSDQYYRDEWVWYNPLLPWALALGSAITGTSVEVLHLRLRSITQSRSRHRPSMMLALRPLQPMGTPDVNALS